VQLHLDQPLWLLSGLLALPMAAAAMLAFATMSRWRRVLSALLRTLLILLIAVVLAGLASVRETRKLAIIAVVDVSGSIQRQAVDGMEKIRRGGEGSDGAGSAAQVTSTLEAVRLQLLRATANRGAEDLLGIVAFDGGQMLIASPSPAKLVADRPLEYTSREGTNIAGALSFAASLVPPDATGRILLITDGVQTEGDGLKTARELASASGLLGTVGLGTGGAQSGVLIDAVPLKYTVRPEVLIESVDSPPVAAVGAPVTVRAILRSTDATTGTIRLLDNGQELDVNGDEPGMGRRMELVPGANVFVAEVPIGTSRVHRFRVVYEPDAVSGTNAGDRIAANNEAEAFTITPSVGSVLHVDGVAEFSDSLRSSPLAQTLRDADINVTTVEAGGIPTDLLSLQNYDLVILENVPADAVSQSSQQAIAAHVRDMGSGLIMIGGPMSFASGGWQGSTIEPILPVKLDLPDTVVESEAAIVFVLDNSGSMSRSIMGSSRSQQEIANESAARAVLSLNRKDLIGVITFNNDYDIVTPLGPNSSPESTANAIRQITAGGGTNAGPALEEARRALSSVKAKVKHVVLLSDGKSQRSDSIPEIATRMRGEGITVSAISIGDGADLPTMKAIASNGGGEHFNPTNPNILPRIFLKAIRVVRTPMYREEPFEPIVLDSASVGLRGLGKPPTLGGLNLTQARGEPTISTSMTTPKGEPLLASWRAELGQVAAFTSDAGDWASRWIEWPGYGQFWTQLVRSVSRPSQQRLFQTRLTAEGTDLKLTMDAIAEDGTPIEFLRTPATVYAPSGEAIEVELRQTGSGVYETTLRAEETGTYVAVVRPSMGDRVYAPVIAGTAVRFGVESQRLEPDPGLVSAIAQAGGGRVIELSDLGAADLFNRSGLAARRTLLPMAELLLPWLLVLALLDIAMRRIAWDRMSEDRPATAKGAVQSLAERLSSTGASPQVASQSASTQATPAVFSEQDAADLIRAQRDRRMAERLAAARSAQNTSSSAPSPGESATNKNPQTKPDAAPTEPESGLAAAKRRARQRYEED
jgi:Ca-activated chloride channel family protein